MSLLDLRQRVGGQFALQFFSEQGHYVFFETFRNWYKGLEYCGLVGNAELLTLGQVSRHGERLQIAAHVVIGGAGEAELKLALFNGCGTHGLRQAGHGHGVGGHCLRICGGRVFFTLWAVHCARLTGRDCRSVPERACGNLRAFCGPLRSL